jgi:tripartite-type tricarboxylate transporter receptor subunit TctC
MLKRIFLFAATGALLAIPVAAQPDVAATYPSRSVRVIVTVPAGGGVDSVTRIFADKLQRRLGQPFVIENQGGAGGNVGASTVYGAVPDGYTLMSSQPAPLTTNIALYKKLSFDPAALEPVVIMSRFPNVLLVRKDFPAKTAAEFIAYAKANPGKLNYGSQGIGTTSHLTTELFMSLTGTSPEPRWSMCPTRAPPRPSMISWPVRSTSSSWSFRRRCDCIRAAMPEFLQWQPTGASIRWRKFRP